MKSATEYGLVIRNKKLFTPGAKKPLEPTSLLVYLIQHGVDPADSKRISVELTDEAINQEVFSKQNKEQQFDRIMFKIKRKNILLNSVYKQKLRSILLNGKILAYMVTDSGWVNLGLMLDVIKNPKDLYAIFTIKHSEGLAQLQNEIEELSTELGGPQTYNHYQITEMYFEDIMPAAEDHLEKEFNRPPYPLLLTNDNRPALQYLTFNESIQPFLNPHLKDFLSRMHNHKYFCAYLFCSLKGYEIQQVLYLYGAGGNGKSTLFRMLQDKIQSYATYSEGSQFSFSTMVDKALVFLSENTQEYLLRNPLVKKLTGRDIVSIEAKGKNAYSDRIRGLFIVDSNKQPYIYGQKSETRRLRLFEIEGRNSEDTMSPEEAAAAYGVNFDGFIAYCKQCYEELKTVTNLVQDPIDLEEQLANLRDPEKEVIYDKMIEKLKHRKIGINPELSIKIKLLHTHIEAIKERDKGGFSKDFFVSNFIDYLTGTYKCRKDREMFIGIGDIEIPEESTGHTRVVKKLSP